MSWRFDPTAYRALPGPSDVDERKVWRYLLEAAPTTLFVEERTTAGGARTRYRCVTQEQFTRDLVATYDMLLDSLPSLHELLTEHRDVFMTWPEYARVQEPRRVFYLGPSTL